MPSLGEICPVVLEKIFKFHKLMYFRFFFLFPLEIGRGPSFEKTSIPFTQGCFALRFVEIGPVVLEKKTTTGPGFSTVV